jgi:hypothetical protein
MILGGNMSCARVADGVVGAGVGWCAWEAM